MKAKNTKTSVARREFLKTASLGVGAAAGAGTVLKAEDAQAKLAKKGQQGLGYQETEHVKRYYETARM